jgi:hypothetical protein
VRKLIAVISIALLAAACGSGSTGNGAVVPASVATSTLPTTTLATTTTASTTTVKTAAPRVFAMLVASHDAEIRRNMAYVEPCVALREKCIARASLMGALETPLAFLILDLRDAMRPTRPTFLGEMQDVSARLLLSNTLNHASEAAAAARAIMVCDPTDPCSDDGARLLVASAQLRTDLSRWQQYP